MQLKEFLEYALKNVNNGVSWHHNLVRAKGQEQVFTMDLDDLARCFDQLPEGPLNATVLHEILSKPWCNNSKINEIQGMVKQLLEKKPEPAEPAEPAPLPYVPPAEPRVFTKFGDIYTHELRESDFPHAAIEDLQMFNLSGLIQRVNRSYEKKIPLLWDDIKGMFRNGDPRHVCSYLNVCAVLAMKPKSQAVPLPPTREQWRGWGYVYPCLVSMLSFPEKVIDELQIINPQKLVRLINESCDFQKPLTYDGVKSCFSNDVIVGNVFLYLRRLSM